MHNPIPVNTPLLDGNELKYLTECIKTGWISSEGPYVVEFENIFSKYVNREFGIAVANGSAALDIAVKALDFAPGDEIIMPAFTIISPAQSVFNAGAVPVLIDSDPVTWNMDVSLIEARITPKTKAILVVHMYGLPTDMDIVLELCKKYNLKLIEDAAEVHGQTYKGKMCGSFGDVSTFSFYPNKHITTGEGGMIVCNDKKLAERCKRLRNLAFEPGRRFVHRELGWNYRMTNMQAALGVAQMERIDSHILRKREVGKLYLDGLSQLKNIKLPLLKIHYSENIFWIFGIVLDPKGGANAEAAMSKLAKLNVGTRPFFYPMHLQPVFLENGLFKNEKYPISEQLSEFGFYIPSGLGISDSEIDCVIQDVVAVLS